MVLRELNRLNIDIGILTESKLTHGIHTRRAFGYNVYAMEAISPHKGGVALIWRDSFSWSLESERLHGPNVVSFELRTTVHRYLVVGAYISSSEEDGSTLDYIQCAIDRRPGLRTILLGDFNVDFQEPGASSHKAEILTSIAGLGLDNGLDNFHLSCRHYEGYTWKQLRDGDLVTSRCDNSIFVQLSS